MVLMVIIDYACTVGLGGINKSCKQMQIYSGITCNKLLLNIL